ncbi:unnamed protein product [Periconia digitata]|uniref:Uncharacterized protein n=1 Tax=Periconia digitata TaxID=1303443 RepID=A0A9W4UH98_9PLEO|nr:unnamed protein product [Periconia digitata]
MMYLASKQYTCSQDLITHLAPTRKRPHTHYPHSPATESSRPYVSIPSNNRH